MEANGLDEMITIVGMHRSGTSALAGAIHKLGADLGPPSSWVPPATDNPRGFFEYAPVVDLNRDALLALGGTWSSPPPLPPGWVGDERLEGLRQLVADVVAEIPPDMVVKDPRLSLLLPFWEEVTEVPVSMVCVRHPVAVAKSLVTRNHFSVDHSLFLWFRYNAAAVLNRPDSLVVEYELLLASPADQLRRIADHISLDASPTTVEAAASSVHGGMSHHQPEPLPDTPIGEMCRRLYDLLRSEQPLETDHEVWVWARLVTELPWTGPGDREIGRLRSQLADSEREVATLLADNRKLEKRQQRLDTEMRHVHEMLDKATIEHAADLLRSRDSR